MVDIVVSVAGKVAEYLVAPFGRQCGYLIFSDSHVRQLNGELKKLDHARQRVQHSVNQFRNNMRLIEADVEEWMTEAETVANKADKLLENGGRAQKTCFHGWLPNPMARYRLGKKMSKTVKDIQELIKQGQFEKVDFENPPPALVGGASDVNSSASVGGDTITDSRASIFQDIMKALDDEKLKVIGVYGPGGVGKTTLLKEVEKKLREAERPFRMIVKVEVSQIPDLNNIRDQIADALSLDLKDKQSPQRKADVLSKRLKRDPNETFLIIFDNLWEKVDLEAVGIPWGDVSSKCKLLLTSRFKDVLEQEMGADRTFLLQGLKNDEAFGLFEKMVGDRLKDNEELKSIADQLVKKLAGLPLLIISIASTLKSSDESAWRNALIEIDDSNKRKKETIVRLSYNHLKSEDAKFLFLLCGLIGGTIQVELLFVLAMGLGLFERFNKTIQASRDRLNNMLNELRSACLLLDGGNDKDNVTIHDLYSEVVVSTPFQDQNSLMMNNNNYLWSKEKIEKCWAICLDDVHSDRLAELMLCQFPSLKILMLSMPKVSGWMQKYRHGVGDCLGPLDFTDMKELRVLYLRSMHITNLPPSIEILGKLRSLYLYDCNVKDVAIIGKLKALQILSFARSTIHRLPEEMGELTNLRLLNLSDCAKLWEIKPTILKRLIKLEELHMKGSFDRWMAKNEKPLELCNAGLAELRSMTKLNSLEISIRDPIVLLEVDDLPFENLTRFWINIGKVDGREFKGLRTMKIKLEGHDSILSKKWVQKFFQKTQYLCLDGLKEFENAHELCIQGIPQLKHLDIQNSLSIKYITNPSNSAFTILESLFLDNLINLEKICHRHIATECFSKLKAVRVKECNRLKYLWCLSQMQNLQLEKIEVWKCGSMRAIARIDIVSTNYRVELPYLRCLDLVQLPNMTSFCTGAEITSEGAPIQAGVMDGGGGDEGTELVTTTSDLQNTYSDSSFDGKISLPNLEDLKLTSMGPLKRIWHDEISRSSFCKLTTITINNCSDLLHIFPSTIIGGLNNLKSVNVQNCPSLRSLFDFGSLDSNTEQTTVLLPELVSINVGSCPSLESLFNCGFLDSKDKIVLLPKLKQVRVSGAKRLRYMVMSHSQIGLGLPSLETISVRNCSDLRYLFSNYTASTLMKLNWLIISKCEQMKEVIVEKEAGRSEAEVLSFPCLSTLTLEELDNLISFGSGSCSYYFSSLKSLRIMGCCNFGVFIPSPTSVKRQLGKMAEENDESPQPLFNEMVTFPNIINLDIEGVPCKELSNNHVPANSIVCSHRFLLKNVKVKNCSSLKSLFDFGYLDSNIEQIAVLLPELVSINVESCPSLESLFNCGSLDSNDKIVLLPKLKEVRVSGAKRLRYMVMSHSQIGLGFPSLETVSVQNCSDLRYLFSKYTAKTVVTLKTLEITKCEQMKEVILEKEAGQSEVEVMSFPCLSTLTLKELNNLISFGSGSCSYYFSSLKSLRIVRCCNFGAFIPSPTSVKRQLVKTAEENDELPQPLFNEMVKFPNIINLDIIGVPCKELWNNHVPADSIVCSHRFLLKNVKVINCPSLKSLFDFGSLDSNMEQTVVLLPELVSIIVRSCPSLESLFNCRSLDSNDKIVLLPKLKEVRVSEAKRLRYMVMSHSQIGLGFPSLETVTVQNCYGLRYLFSKYTATTLMKLKWLMISECEHMKEVILEKEAGRSKAEVMSFPCLSTLTLEELNNLISFSSGSCSYYFSSLKSLRIVGCCNFGVFIPSPTSVKRQLGKTAEENDESPQPLFNEMVTFPNLINLVIEGVPCKDLWNNHVPADSIVCSQRFLSEKVNVKNCPSLKSLFDFGSLDSNTEQDAVLLPKLVKIDVESCPSLESLFNCGSLDSNVKHKVILLPKLEIVTVSGARKLRHVVMSHSQIVLGFPSLITVSVKNCSDLRYLFSKYTATTLMKLKWLNISKCEEMKEVILEKEASRSEAEVMSFPCLSGLALEELDNLISFGSGSCSYYFSSLTYLRIVGCYNFEAFIPTPTSVKRQLGKTAEENDESPQPLFNEMVTFPNIRNINIENVQCKELWNHYVPADSIVCSHQFLLDSVKVKNCPSLKSLFDFGSLDSNMEQNAVLLPKLERINVESCPSLESLFNCGSLDSNAKHKIILLPKLEIVKVSGAKKLRHVVMSHSQIVLGFPSLVRVSVQNCSDLRYLFSKYTASTLMKLKWLNISKCEQMKEVIIEKEAGQSEAEVMSFPCLSTLTLEELDNLISFSSGSCSYYFSSLKSLRIVRCCNFGAFNPSPTSVKRQLGKTAEENDESPQPLFNEMVTFPNIINLDIEGVPCKELWNNHVPADSIVCSHRFLLKNVKVKNCPSLKSFFDFGSLDSNTEQTAVLLPELVSINVESCPSLESLFNCGFLDSNDKIVLLPKLKEVRVSGAKRLRYMVMSHSQIGLGFPSLETVSVRNCSDLRYLFSKYTATTLVTLQALEITKCEQMKEVIVEKEASRSETEVMSFPCLSTLTLEELDNLISFGSQSCSYYFSSLKCLRIVGCCNFGAFIPSLTSVKRQLGETVKENDGSPQPLFNEMVTFPDITSLKIKGLRCNELWSNQIPTNSFQMLEYLKLDNCDNLQHIATSYMWKKLQCCLEELEVISCHSIEIIYNSDGTDTESGKLWRLILHNLENLRHIWQSDDLLNISFPNLRVVETVRCPRLKILFPTFTVKFLRQIEELVVESCENMELIAGHEKWEEATGVTITFSKLTTLSLFNLPKFRRFFLPEKYSLKFSCFGDFPSLRGLSIESCGVEPDQVLGDWRFLKTEREWRSELMSLQESWLP